MQRMEVTYLQMTLIGIGVGFALGLIPLVLGIVKKKLKLGLLGLLCSTAAGAVWSIIALIVTIVFCWLILRKKAPEADAPPAADEAEPES